MNLNKSLASARKSLTGCHRCHFWGRSCGPAGFSAVFAGEIDVFTLPGAGTWLTCCPSVSCWEPRGRPPPLRPGGRDILGINDGWGAVATAALPHGHHGRLERATAARTVTVTNRKELVAALAYPDPTPEAHLRQGRHRRERGRRRQGRSPARTTRGRIRPRARCIRSTRSWPCTTRKARTAENNPCGWTGRSAPGLGRRAGSARAHPHSTEHHSLWRGQRRDADRRLARHPRQRAAASR